MRATQRRPGPMRWGSATRLVAAVVVTVLAGCSGGSDDDPVTVSVAAGQVDLAEGEVLQVDLGPYNASIGDSWQVTGAPNPAVLRDDDQTVEPDADCGTGQVGCGGSLTWEFTAIGRGSTTIEFRYCYRSRVPDCDPGPDRGPAQPVTLGVTVR